MNFYGKLAPVEQWHNNGHAVLEHIYALLSPGGLDLTIVRARLRRPFFFADCPNKARNLMIEHRA